MLPFKTIRFQYLCRKWYRYTNRNYMCVCCAWPDALNLLPQSILATHLTGCRNKACRSSAYLYLYIVLKSIQLVSLPVQLHGPKCVNSSHTCTCCEKFKKVRDTFARFVECVRLNCFLPGSTSEPNVLIVHTRYVKV